MDSIKRWLDKYHLGYEIWNMTEGDNAIVVNHDYVGLYPTIPQYAAGLRIESPVSEPVAYG